MERHPRLHGRSSGAVVPTDRKPSAPVAMFLLVQPARCVPIHALRRMYQPCIGVFRSGASAFPARFSRVPRMCSREIPPRTAFYLPVSPKPPPFTPKTPPKPPPNRPATHPRTATSQHRAWPHPRSTSLQHPLGTTRSTWRCESLTGASPRAPRASPAASTGCTVLLEPPRSRPWASREPLVAPPGLCVALGLGTRASGLLEATWGVPWRHRRMHPPAPAR